MKKVWVIEDGVYSDYRVVGIFTTRDNALTVAHALNLDDSSVNEWVTNPAVNELNAGRWPYWVLMMRDGVVEKIARRDEVYELENTSFVWDRPNAPAYAGKNIPAVLNCTVWARNEKHAIKIANEIRTQKIAGGEWK